jgi:hypothetical protein
MPTSRVALGFIRSPKFGLCRIPIRHECPESRRNPPLPPCQISYAGYTRLLHRSKPAEQGLRGDSIEGVVGLTRSPYYGLALVW